MYTSALVTPDQLQTRISSRIGVLKAQFSKLYFTFQSVVPDLKCVQILCFERNKNLERFDRRVMCNIKKNNTFCTTYNCNIIIIIK